MKKLFFYIILCCLLTSCKKEEKDEDAYLSSFISLVADNDTIFTGQSTKITATAEGQNISFFWTASAGDILGSGNVVTYIAPTCVPGINEISCTASAGSSSEKKTINITVF